MVSTATALLMIGAMVIVPARLESVDIERAGIAATNGSRDDGATCRESGADTEGNERRAAVARSAAAGHIE